LPNVSKTYRVCRVIEKCHPVVPPIAPRTSIRSSSLEFPQHADIGTGLLNAHLAPS
jgi:hypothetical protein